MLGTLLAAGEGRTVFWEGSEKRYDHSWEVAATPPWRTRSSKGWRQHLVLETCQTNATKGSSLSPHEGTPENTVSEGTGIVCRFADQSNQRIACHKCFSLSCVPQMFFLSATNVFLSKRQGGHKSIHLNLRTQYHPKWGLSFHRAVLTYCYRLFIF